MALAAAPLGLYSEIGFRLAIASGKSIELGIVVAKTAEP